MVTVKPKFVATPSEFYPQLKILKVEAMRTKNLFDPTIAGKHKQQFLVSSPDFYQPY